MTWPASFRRTRERARRTPSWPSRPKRSSYASIVYGFAAGLSAEFESGCFDKLANTMSKDDAVTTSTRVPRVAGLRFVPDHLDHPPVFHSAIFRDERWNAGIPPHFDYVRSISQRQDARPNLVKTENNSRFSPQCVLPATFNAVPTSSSAGV